MERRAAGESIRRRRIWCSVVVATLTAVAARHYGRICSAHDPINKEP